MPEANTIPQTLSTPRVLVLPKKAKAIAHWHMVQLAIRSNLITTFHFHKVQTEFADVKNGFVYLL